MTDLDLWEVRTLHGGEGTTEKMSSLRPLIGRSGDGQGGGAGTGWGAGEGPLRRHSRAAAHYAALYNGPGQPRAALHVASVEVLAQVGAGEPVKPKEIVRMAEEAGFSERMVYRARSALEGGVNTAGKRADGNRWELADGMADR